MPNEAHFSVAGFVATPPHFSATKTGLPTMTMRVAWTPRRVDRSTGEWVDEPACFVSVRCFGRTAENCKLSLEKGDPVVVTGTLKMHDYESKQGTPRTSVDITATAIGHDLSRGTSVFRRRRPKSEPAAEEGQEGQEPESGDMAASADGGQVPGAAGEPGALAGPAGSDPEDMAPADHELEDEEAGVMEQAGEPAAAPF